MYVYIVVVVDRETSWSDNLEKLSDQAPDKGM